MCFDLARSDRSIGRRDSQTQSRLRQRSGARPTPNGRRWIIEISSADPKESAALAAGPVPERFAESRSNRKQARQFPVPHSIRRRFPSEAGAQTRTAHLSRRTKNRPIQPRFLFDAPSWGVPEANWTTAKDAEREPPPPLSRDRPSRQSECEVVGESS